jgi:membrane protease YdiL (CAAX protease family)
MVCGLSWGLIGGSYALGLKWQGANMMLLGMVLMWLPGVVALVMERRDSPGRVRDRLGLRFARSRWWVMAWLIAPAMILVSMGLSLMLPEHVWFSDPGVIIDQLAGELTPEVGEETVTLINNLPIPLAWLQLIGGLTTSGLMTAIFALGEEIGWRGFLDREADARGWGFWKSSFVIGAIWGLWHWPVIVQGHNWPAHPYLGVLLMVVFCMGMGPIFTFVTRMTGSVFAAALAHGTMNATAVMPILSISGGGDLTVGITSFVGFAVIALVNLAMIPLVKKHQVRLDGFWAEQAA